MAKNNQQRKVSDTQNTRKNLRAKGGTVPGTHIPVLMDEVFSLLNPQPGEVVIDCTLGYGGHTRGFAGRIGQQGRLIGLDVDGAELERTRYRLSKLNVQMSFCRKNFSEITDLLAQESIDGVDIIFADLGVSSMQVDDPDRGISYKSDGPLDMRMDDRLTKTGADMLMTLSEQQLSGALWEFSDEPDHATIAQWIVNQRQSDPITQVSQLVRLVFNVKGITERTWKKKQKASRFGSLHPAARTFQALRILVNDEIGSLKKLLEAAPSCLNPGGRIGIISFQRREDSLVKQYFSSGYDDGVYESTSKDAITPRTKEIVTNPRCSSAKFRWAKLRG